MNASDRPIDCTKTGSLTVNRNFAALLADSGLGSFEALWHCRAGRPIKQIAPRSVVCIEIADASPGGLFYLKRHYREYLGPGRLLPPGLHRRCRSQGRLEFENIAAFRRSSLATVSPAAWGERARGRLWAESLLLTADFAPFVPLEAIVRDTPEFFAGRRGRQHKKSVLEAVGRYARRMHAAGFNHRDFNATHILLDFAEHSRGPAVALFDLQRIDRCRLFRFRWIIKSLAELYYTLPSPLFGPQDLIFLFQAYKNKRRLSLWDRFQLWWIKRKTARIARHTQKRRARRRAARQTGQ